MDQEVNIIAGLGCLITALKSLYLEDFEGISNLAKIFTNLHELTDNEKRFLQSILKEASNG